MPSGGSSVVAPMSRRLPDASLPSHQCLGSTLELPEDHRHIAGESGDIAAGPGQACDEAGANRIDDVCEHDRERAVASSNGRMVENPLVKITSGPVATISTARLRMRPGSPAAQRVSMRTFRPMPQPSSCSPCINAPWRTDASGSSPASVSSTPMRRMRCGCCAHVANGHTAAAPPTSVMNSRLRSGRDVRFIARPPHRTVRAAFPHTAPTSGL